MIAAALVVLAQPAATASIPIDYDRAVQARQAGHPNEALRILDRLRAAKPQDADIALQRGLALFQAGRRGEAKVEFRRTLLLAPTYDEARVGLARIAYGRGENDSAAAQLEPLAARGVPEARELLEQVQAAIKAVPPDWQVDVSTAYSSFKDGRADWVDVAIGARYRLSPTVRLTGSIQPSHRFGRTEVYSELGAEVDLAPNASVHGSVGFTPDADFRPGWRVSAGTRVKVREGDSATVVLFDVTQASYAVGDVQTLTPGIEQYFAGGRAWVTGQWINLVDENGRMRTGWSLRGDTLATDRLRLYAGYAHTPDTSAGRTIRTKTVFGGAAYNLSDRFSLNLSLAHEDRSIGSDRNVVALGFGAAF